MKDVGCEHTFSYLLKDHGEVYTGSVLELPAIVVSGTPEEIEKNIIAATREYLEVYNDDHEKARSGKLKPALRTPSEGIVIQTKKFIVKC